MEKSIIRLATDEDLDTISRIAVAAWEPVYESFRKTAGDKLFAIVHPDWRAEKTAQVVGHYRSYPETTLVTEYAGEVVGFITYNLFEHKKAGIIGNNAIHPDYQSRGLGTKQYQKVLDIFRESGMVYAEVLTGADEAHAPARTAYERAGFKPVVYSVRYYQKLSPYHEESQNVSSCKQESEA